MSKKLIIPRDQLPAINAFTRQYDVRFRITTEDRNRFSYWSPIFSIRTGIFYEVGTLDLRGKIALEKIGSSYVGITWDSVTAYKLVGDVLEEIGELQEYDVWIRWAGNGGINPGEWLHKTRVTTNSLNINIPDEYQYESGSSILYATPKYLYVEIHRPTRPILRYEETREFPQNSTTVDIDNDYIYFAEGHGTVTATPGLYESASPIGGLSDSNTYYTRTIDYYRISLHPTKQDAIDNTNKINLTSTGSGTGSFTGFTFRLYDALITTL